jgi:outer membrane protein
MKRTRRFLAVLVLAFATVFPADSMGQSQTAQQSDRDEEGFTWSVGGGMIASPRPYVGTKAKIFPIPVINARYKRFYFQGIRGGFDFIQRGDLTASGFLMARFRGLEPEDSDFLEGMQTRKKSADAGLELNYRGRPVGFRMGFVSDVLGRSKGQEISFAATSGIPLGKVLILGGFGPRWLSSKRVDYYYGVMDSEATPWRPSYTAQDTWNWDLNVTTIWNMTDRWQLFALFNREGLGSQIKESPLIDRNSAYSLLFSITYRIR